MTQGTSTRGDKRQAILEAALTLFSTRTFNGTPMPLLAKQAGVGAGTIYRYFSSKEELGNAVFRHCSSALLRVLREAARENSTPRAEVHGIWRGLWEFAGKNPEAFRFLELHHHEPYLDAESRAADDQLRGFASDYVRRAQAAGVMREAEPAMLIGLVWGAFVGLTKEFEAGRVLRNDDIACRSEEAVWCLVARPR
jgi:AcrR family transcriptional regulator